MRSIDVHDSTRCLTCAGCELATRLPAWIAHDDRLEWPSGINVVQVRFGAGELEIAGSSTDGPVWRGLFEVTLKPGILRLRPVGAGIGRLPIPGIGVRELVRLIPDGSLGVDGSIDLAAEFQLVDDRVVRLVDLELTKGDLGVVFSTISPGNPLQDQRVRPSINRARTADADSGLEAQ